MDRFERGRSKVLEFPDHTAEEWYAFCPGGATNCGNDNSYNGPTAVFDNDLLFSVFKASDGERYLAVVGSYAQVSALSLEFRSDTEEFPIATDGSQSYPAGGIPTLPASCPTPPSNRPSFIRVADDPVDCFFRGGEPWEPDCFEEGDGMHVKLAWAAGNSDGFVMGPLPVGGFAIAVRLTKTGGASPGFFPPFEPGGVANGFRIQSVSYQGSSGYQRILDIDPNTFESATFVIRGRPLNRSNQNN